MGVGQLIRDLLNAQIQQTGEKAYGTPDWQEKRAVDQAAAQRAQTEVASMPTPEEARTQREAQLEATRGLSDVRGATSANLTGRLSIAQADAALRQANAEYARDPTNPRNKLMVAQAQKAVADAKEAEAQAGLASERTLHPEKFRAAGSTGAIGSTLRIWDGNKGKEMIVDKRTGAILGEAAPPAAMRGLGQMGEVAQQMIGNPDDPNQPDSIWALVRRINTKSGLAGRAAGVARRGLAAAGLDEDVQVYSDQLRGMASRLAKAFGESGRLSDQDIERTVNMFPRVGDSPNVTERKMKRISTLIDALGDDPTQNHLLVNTFHAMNSADQEDAAPGAPAGPAGPAPTPGAPEQWGRGPDGKLRRVK